APEPRRSLPMRRRSFATAPSFLLFSSIRCAHAAKRHSRLASIARMDDRGTPAIAYRFLDWRYEPALRRLVGPAGEARLKPLLDRLLRRLLDEPGAVLARERLIDEVWTRREVNDEVLSRAIAELRGVLGDDARAPRYVETLSKGGYRW